MRKIIYEFKTNHSHLLDVIKHRKKDGIEDVFEIQLYKQHAFLSDEIEKKWVLLNRDEIKEIYKIMKKR